MDLGGGADVVLVGHILGNALVAFLGVPTMKTPLSSWINAVERCVPVMMVPVLVADVVIDQHVVDEVIDVEHIGQVLVVRSVGEVLPRKIDQRIVVRGNPFDDFALIMFDDVVIVLVATEVSSRKRLVWPFVNVIIAPVETVDIQMVPLGGRRKPSHGLLEIGYVLILDIFCIIPLVDATTTTTIRPAEIQLAVEDDGIEGVRGLGSENRIVQLGRPKLLRKLQHHLQPVDLPSVGA